jgi:hypothetical protein
MPAFQCRKVCCKGGNPPIGSEARKNLAKRPVRDLQRLALLAILFWGAGMLPLCAQQFLDEETERLLVAAVEAAAELDLYNARCRSDSSGRHTDNLNKELVSRFRITVLEIEDDLFPERSYREVQARLQRDFLAKLKKTGGCKEAKRAGLPKQLRARYDELMQQIDRLP